MNLSTIERLLQIAEARDWACPSDSARRTDEETALISKGLIEEHPSPYSAQIRVTRRGARLVQIIRTLAEEWVL